MLNDSHTISKFDIFRNLSVLETKIIERNVYKRVFKSGELIVNENDAAVGIYLIESGEVKVYKTFKNKRIELATLSAGSFFGELTLLMERKRTATVIATEPTVLLCLFRPEFLELLRQYPTLCSKFLPRFSEIIIDRIYNMYAELQSIRTA